ncbi:MAG: HAD family hydrolase [Desulfobacterales bacterium]|nr:HAD family hydrolase [Desulfobacterales bacterium]MBF0397991.1 HAD family hydrolase [Desulfobacterales bacterium]
MKVPVFFDLDHTIIDGNSVTEYTRLSYDHGKSNMIDILKSTFYYILYRLNMLDIEESYKNYAISLKGKPEQAMIDFCKQLVDEKLKNIIFSEAMDLINYHKRIGNLLVLISNSTQYVVKPMAEYLGFDDFMSTHIEVYDGIFTGNIRKPLCYGKGKLCLADEWVKERSMSLDNAYFYTDSYSDIELLEKVGKPVVVNPDFKLAYTAFKNDWPLQRFFGRL